MEQRLNRTSSLVLLGEQVVQKPPVVVSVKELTIVIFVLLLWVGAIALFYHQWDKINGLGNYQLDYVHANLTATAKPVNAEVVVTKFFTLH